jgi:cation transport protein ChaC
MWVFGYGSLMWDGWEAKFHGTRHDLAVLSSYRRSFNKASKRNWGSLAAPCPTLGLEPDTAAKCVGTAFEFANADEVLTYLKKREGPDFSLPERDIVLPSGITVHAVVPVNDRNRASYVGTAPVENRAAQAQTARGEKGLCREYVAALRSKLRELGIVDPAVEEFASLVSEVA